MNQTIERKIVEKLGNTHTVLDLFSLAGQKHYTANVYRQTTDKLMFISVISTVR